MAHPQCLPRLQQHELTGLRPLGLADESSRGPELWRRRLWSFFVGFRCFDGADGGLCRAVGNGFGRRTDLEADAAFVIGRADGQHRDSISLRGSAGRPLQGGRLLPCRRETRCLPGRKPGRCPSGELPRIVGREPGSAVRHTCQGRKPDSAELFGRSACD